MDTAFYKTCIQEELARRCEKNSRYSLRAFAKALGFEPTVISQIISGKRVPSLKTAEKLVAALNLSPEEQDHFLASLAETHRARGLERLNPFFRKFKGVPAQKKELTLDLFRIIADWYHYAILALSLTEDFKPNPKWIASELGISETETKLAIDRLLNLGFLIQENGSIKCATEVITTADKQITDSALKRHQKQVLEKAIFSLENDSIGVRSMTSMTMAADPDRLPTAKQMIEEFTQRLTQFLESGRRTQVYELGIALFPIQIRRSEK